MTAPTQVFIVSDLHLGGPDRFRMCSPAGAARLAEFVQYVTRTKGNVHLVLAGDVVDLLAEPDEPPPAKPTWSAFTAEADAALDKLRRIFESTADVWTALADLVAAGHALTVMLGNHDVELALPRVRAALLAKLGERGRVTLLRDNEAFTLGGLIVEHGCRYDPWNAVDHDGLRRVCSAQSRREPVESARFERQPGSELVAQVMNRIKLTYGFVDLLKPETGVVLPILAVLDPGVWTSVRGAVEQMARAAWRRRLYDAEGQPTGEMIRAPEATARAPAGAEMVGATPPADGAMADADAFRLADTLAREAPGASRELVGVGEAVKKLETRLLLKAFRKTPAKMLQPFQVTAEEELYAKAATRLVRDRRFQVVVFGHTHHVKRIAIDQGTYLNTGTWADLMRLPPDVLSGTDEEALRALEAFLEKVQANDIAAFRRQVPTFARVLVSGGDVVEKDVLFYDGGDTTASVDDAGVLARLAPGKP